MIKPFRGEFRLTQGFGENPASYAKFGMKGHNGLDYGLPTGTQIIAPHGGKIIETSSDPTGYGNYIKIENDKEGSVLAHLKSFQVKVGDMVSEGQPIGISNNTGNSTGPHLHWGYYLFPRNRQNGYAGFIDQIKLIAQPAPTPDLQKQLDQMRKERDDNHNLYQQALKDKKASETALQGQIDTLKNRLDRIKTIANE